MVRLWLMSSQPQNGKLVGSITIYWLCYWCCSRRYDCLSTYWECWLAQCIYVRWDLHSTVLVLVYFVLPESVEYQLIKRQPNSIERINKTLAKFNIQAIHSFPYL